MNPSYETATAVAVRSHLAAAGIDMDIVTVRERYGMVAVKIHKGTADEITAVEEAIARLGIKANSIDSFQTVQGDAYVMFYYQV